MVLLLEAHTGAGTSHWRSTQTPIAGDFNHVAFSIRRMIRATPAPKPFRGPPPTGGRLEEPSGPELDVAVHDRGPVAAYKNPIVPPAYSLRQQSTSCRALQNWPSRTNHWHYRTSRRSPRSTADPEGLDTIRGPARSSQLVRTVNERLDAHARPKANAPRTWRSPTGPWNGLTPRSGRQHAAFLKPAGTSLRCR